MYEVWEISANILFRTPPWITAVIAWVFEFGLSYSIIYHLYHFNRKIRKDCFKLDPKTNYFWYYLSHERHSYHTIEIYNFFSKFMLILSIIHSGTRGNKIIFYTDIAIIPVSCILLIIFIKEDKA